MKFIPLVTSATALCLFAVPVSLSAANREMEQEYIQVRKIALKDARVQAAFQRANEKLDERIIEIDPSLKPCVDRQKKPAAQPAKQTPPAPAKHQSAPKKTGAGTATHVVVRGETLSTIAEHYKISVARLKNANSITDERKLHVGQKLLIPSAKNSTPTKEKDDGFWGKIRKSLD